MAFPDEPQGGEPSSGERVPPHAPGEASDFGAPEHHSELPPDGGSGHSIQYDETYSYSDSWSSSSEPGNAVTLTPPAAAPPATPPPPPTRPPSGSGGPPKPPEPPDEDDEEEGMTRMSFLEHLEELRKRLILAIGGIGVAF